MGGELQTESARVECSHSDVECNVHFHSYFTLAVHASHTRGDLSTPLRVGIIYHVLSDVRTRNDEDVHVSDVCARRPVWSLRRRREFLLSAFQLVRQVGNSSDKSLK